MFHLIICLEKIEKKRYTKLSLDILYLILYIDGLNLFWLVMAIVVRVSDVAPRPPVVYHYQ